MESLRDASEVRHGCRCGKDRQMSVRGLQAYVTMAIRLIVDSFCVFICLLLT